MKSFDDIYIEFIMRIHAPVNKSKREFSNCKMLRFFIIRFSGQHMYIIKKRMIITIVDKYSDNIFKQNCYFLISTRFYEGLKIKICMPY